MTASLLDTDTISYFIKGNTKVASRLEEYFDHFGFLNISVITYYEIKNGLLFRDAHRQMKDFEVLFRIAKCCPSPRKSLT